MQGERVVLEALAAIESGEEPSANSANSPPNFPLIWLSQNPVSLNTLPTGSRWVLWQTVSLSQPETLVNQNYPGFVIQTGQPLQLQLQKPLVISH